MSSAPTSELAGRIELALVDPRATRPEIERACQEAVKHGLYGVGISSSRIVLLHSLLEDSPLKVIGLVDFPWGTADADVKRFETETAVDLGAQEIEMVINVGRLKDGDHKAVIRELRDVVEAADERPVKAVLQTDWLTVEELKLACELLLDSGVQGVCTGIVPSAPPAPEEVRGLRSLLGPKMLLKAAGGIADRASATSLVSAGADRLGVSDVRSLFIQPPHP